MVLFLVSQIIVRKYNYIFADLLIIPTFAKIKN